MEHLRIGLCQMNPTVGAITANAERMVAQAERAVAAGAALLVFPELCLAGYPPEDLVLMPHFIDACETGLESLCEHLPQQPLTIVGLPLPSATRGANGQRAHNSAAVLGNGRLCATYHKQLLPNYGVFDEQRVFAPGHRATCLRVGPARIGVHICEDSWEPDGTAVQSLANARVNALINLSASPFHRGKSIHRETRLRETARHLGAHILYCNQVGGQDELVFDGGSFVLDPDGAVVARAAAFEEDLLLFDLPLVDRNALIDEPADTSIEWVYIEPVVPRPGDAPRQPELKPQPPPLEQVHEALKLGLRDYVDKNGFTDVLIALSGGIDSALVATIAVDALGPERVLGLTLPSQHTSDETLADARALADNLGIQLHTVAIEPLYDEFMRSLVPLWPDRGPDLTEENLQARIRGTLVMALSNKRGHLVLATGNKSELATGYCTLYGDMAGGFAVIKDVPKRLVFELSRWRNRHADRELIPASTIERPPSAELRPDQKDSDSLPPYDILDPILERYVEAAESVDRIVAAGYDRDTVLRIARLVDRAEYKRRQAPPGIKITAKAFGRDRRVPIVVSDQWSVISDQ